MHIFLSRFFLSPKALLHTVLCALLVSACPVIPIGAPMGGMPGLENLSPEEMQMLEQELQAAAQQIDQYVSSLSPEEQAEFHQAVQEVEQMMNSMSEEELAQFFEQIMAAEMEQAQMQGAQPLPMQPQQPTTFEQKPAAVVSKVPLTSAEEKALALLTSLIDLTDKLLVKIDNVIEMQRFFESWAKSGKITGVTPGTTWQQQRNNIDNLRQQLSDLKKTDLKTGKYVFIEAFTKNTTLYSQLEQLNQQLTTYEPQFIVSKFGIDETAKDTSKTALQKCLSAYSTTLESTKADIKKLFEEIGPELAKIKEEEKKLTEKAQTEAGKTRQITPGRTAGAAASMGDYYGGGRGGYDGYDYGRGGYGQDYGYGDYGRPSQAGATDKKTDKDKGSKSPKAGGAGKAKEDSKFEDRKGDKDKDKDKKAQQQADTEKKAEKIVACPADAGEQLNGKYELIASNYKYIEDLLEKDISALDFGKLLQSKNVDPQYALYLFPAVERRLKRLNELVKEYKDLAGKIKDTEQKDAALEKLSKLSKQQPQLTTLSKKLEDDVVKALNGDADKADEFIRAMSPDARYAYFKGTLKLKTPATPPGEEQKPLAEPSETIQKDMAKSALTSLEDIFVELQKLQKAMPVEKPKKEKEEEKAQEGQPIKQQQPAETTTPAKAKQTPA